MQTGFKNRSLKVKLSNPLMTQQARHQTGTTPAAWYEE